MIYVKIVNQARDVIDGATLFGQADATVLSVLRLNQ
jgi:hypothetical protein